MSHPIYGILQAKGIPEQEWETTIDKMVRSAPPDYQDARLNTALAVKDLYFLDSSEIEGLSSNSRKSSVVIFPFLVYVVDTSNQILGKELTDGFANGSMTSITKPPLNDCAMVSGCCIYPATQVSFAKQNEIFDRVIAEYNRATALYLQGNQDTLEDYAKALDFGSWEAVLMTMRNKGMIDGSPILSLVSNTAQLYSDAAACAQRIEELQHDNDTTVYAFNFYEYLDPNTLVLATIIKEGVRQDSMVDITKPSLSDCKLLGCMCLWPSNLAQDIDLSQLGTITNTISNMNISRLRSSLTLQEEWAQKLGYSSVEQACVISCKLGLSDLDTAEMLVRHADKLYYHLKEVNNSYLIGSRIYLGRR